MVQSPLITDKKNKNERKTKCPKILDQETQNIYQTTENAVIIVVYAELLEINRESLLTCCQVSSPADGDLSPW